MVFGTKRQRNSLRGYDHRPLPAHALRQMTLGSAVLAGVTALSVGILCSNLAGIGVNQIDLTATPGEGHDLATRGDRLDLDLVASRGDRLDLVATRGDKLPILKPNAAGGTNVSLFDPHFSLGLPAETFAKSDPPKADDNQSGPTSSQQPPQTATRDTPNVPPTPSRDDRVAQSAASRTPRPALPPTRNASLRGNIRENVAASDTWTPAPTIFEKFFRLFRKPAPFTLAYAAPDDGNTEQRYDRWTAVYDISARTVYMPDGTQLEAHSGLGSRLDDPRSANEKNRGVTPPNVYDLELREKPFHGVLALRLIPEDERNVFGRAGLLAHTFMLGPNGDSNGCVSFRNYDAFLQAYMNQKIKRLAVVTSL